MFPVNDFSLNKSVFRGRGDAFRQLPPLTCLLWEDLRCGEEDRVRMLICVLLLAADVPPHGLQDHGV